MRILVWNMSNGSPPSSSEKHERAWQYLRRNKLRFDVALLQETRDPRPWAQQHWKSVVWSPKYDRPGSRKPLWGSAIIARSLKLKEYEPDERFPWLKELRGSVAVARTPGDPAWLASVHLHTKPIPEPRLQQYPWKEVPISTPNGSIWETDLIPFELRRLFGEETFLWGGDLNSAEAMDDRGFVGGNRKLRAIWREAGSLDLRLRFYDDEQRTFFQPGKGHYQLDHVFADPTTEGRVVSWRVNPKPAERDQPYSDHAPITVVLA